MPSIFDLLNPQQAALAPAALTPTVARPPSILDSPDYRSDRLGDALAGMAQALVKAGGPSQYPQGFAEAFGAAGSGAVQGTQGSEDKFLKRALVNAQVQQAEEQIRSDKAWRDAFSGAAPAGAAPAAVPTGVPAAPGSYDARTASLEGGGKKGGMVYNELGSGAAGPYQFMPATWSAVRAQHPELNLPETIPVDDTPQTRALHDAAHGAFKADNATALQQAGVQPTPDNLYLAHRFGASGAMAVLRADPNKSLAEVLPISWQEKNPDMRGQTAGGFRRLAAERMQGVGGGPQVAAAPGGPAPPAQGDAVPTPAPVQTDGAPPPAAPGGPVQLAQAPGGAPPQQAAPAIPGPVAPPPGGPRTLQDVIQTMPPGVRQMVGAMGRKEGMAQVLKYADPETHVAIDSTTGAIVFAPKTDKSGRYVPVDVMKLDIERQNAASQAKQAAAREEANRIRGANEPMQPGVNGGPPTPTPGFPEAKGAITGAEEGAKVGPELLRYQGQAAIKDHEGSQQAAAKARNSNNNLTQLSTLLQGIDTGKMTATTQEIKAYAKAAGFNLDAMGIKDDVANTQAATALLSQMALEMRSTGEGNGMPGSLSDSDRNFLTSMTPGLATTPEGRTLMVDYQKRLNQRTIDVANIKNKYMQGKQFSENPAGMWEAVGKFVDSHPLFDPAKDKMPAAAAAAAPTVPPMSAIDAEIERRKGKR